MSTVLLYRGSESGSGRAALLEQQAVFAVTRAFLAQPAGDGMRKSRHTLLVPKHLDILPLLALVAEDFAEMVEPESQREGAEAPFILYSDERDGPEEGDSMSAFLHPRWFDPSGDRRLQEVIREYRPEICIVTADPIGLSALARRIEYRFSMVVGFSRLFSQMNVSGESLRETAAQLIVADTLLEKAVDSNAHEMGFSPGDPVRGGAWANLFAEDESRPDLEPFVAFGAAAEMAILLAEQREA